MSGTIPDPSLRSNLTATNGEQSFEIGKNVDPSKIDRAEAPSDVAKLPLKDSLTVKRRVGVILANGLACGSFAALATLLMMHFALGAIVLWGVTLAGTAGTLIGLGSAFYWMFLSHQSLYEKCNAPAIAANVGAVCNAMENLISELRTSNDKQFVSSNDAFVKLSGAINDFARHSKAQRFGLFLSHTETLKIDQTNAQNVLKCLKNMKSCFSAMKDVKKVDQRAIELAHVAEIEFMAALQPKVLSEEQKVYLKHAWAQMLFNAELQDPEEQYDTLSQFIISFGNSIGNPQSISFVKYDAAINGIRRNTNSALSRKENPEIQHQFQLALSDYLYTYFVANSNLEKAPKNEDSDNLCLSMGRKILFNLFDANLQHLSRKKSLTIGDLQMEINSSYFLKKAELDVVPIFMHVRAGGKEKNSEIHNIISKLRNNGNGDGKNNKKIANAISSLTEAKKNFNKILGTLDKIKNNPANLEMRDSIMALGKLIDGAKNRLDPASESDNEALITELINEINKDADFAQDEKIIQFRKEISDSLPSLSTGASLNAILAAAESYYYLLLTLYGDCVKIKYGSFVENLMELRTLLKSMDSQLSVAKKLL
ncbi:MAG: hypothetical protein LBI69_03175 [Puniceicoccales bacterium]|jgi:hypothetical protein|nr:hypothetical protein [Puniceicoccales bacterium]